MFVHKFKQRTSTEFDYNVNVYRSVFEFGENPYIYLINLFCIFQCQIMSFLSGKVQQ